MATSETGGSSASHMAVWLLGRLRHGKPAMNMPLRHAASFQQVFTWRLYARVRYCAPAIFFLTSGRWLCTGIWTCTAHTTKEAEYPVNEFIYLLEGEIVLTVLGTEHTFQAGDAFFIPAGLRLRWHQPAAIRKCYIVFTPGGAAVAAKL